MWSLLRKSILRASQKEVFSEHQRLLLSELLLLIQIVFSYCHHHNPDVLKPKILVRMGTKCMELDFIFLPWAVPLLIPFLQLHNIGPSTISDTLLKVGWPFSARDEFLLYIFHIQTLGPLRCQTNPDINPQDIKVGAWSNQLFCLLFCGKGKKTLQLIFIAYIAKEL